MFDARDDRRLQAPWVGHGPDAPDDAPVYLGYCAHCLRDIYSDEDYVEQGGELFCSENCADEYAEGYDECV